jgi:aspartate/methionine/tyrosine aminotransferase
MTKLAIEHDAVNLAQGFPDFDGPADAVRAANAAARAGKNQYARPYGEPVLVHALAASHRVTHGRDVDPLEEVTVTSGCTEALAASMLGLVNPGDEVVVLEPYYDCYRAVIEMAGGVPRFVPLREPEAPGRAFRLVRSELKSAFSGRTRAVLLNSPHNPTGKVLTREELGWVASNAIERDACVISDEVYEHLVYAPAEHVSIATLPGMAERTLVLGSFGKAFSMTGWKIGWAIGPRHLTAGLRSAHQFLTFATATPLQHGAAAVFDQLPEYAATLRAQLGAMRELLGNALEELGFGVFTPEGAYFIMADHRPFGFADDVAFCRHITAHAGVAAVPPSVFYGHPELGRGLVRFAFCKRRETMERAIERLRAGLRR